MARKYASGNRAWFECGRCGQRGLYRNSMFDGYFPNMRVHPECWEDKHPQENLPKVNDPIALYRPSPENIEQTPPILSVTGDSLSFTLTWTQAETIDGRVESYDVYRSVDGADYVLLSSLSVTYDDFMAILSETLTYFDGDVGGDHTYSYYIGAADRHGLTEMTSNIVDLETVELYRIAEDGTPRITEDGLLFRFIESISRRITEEGDVRATVDSSVRITEV